MVYTQGDRAALKDYFFTNPHIQTVSEDELKLELLEYIHTHLIAYNQVSRNNQRVLRDSQNELNTILTTPTVGLSHDDVRRLREREVLYTGRTSRAEAALNSLENETENLAQNTTNWAKGLKETQNKLYGITGLYGVNIDASKNQAFKDARNVRRGAMTPSNLKKDIAMTDYGNDPEVQNYVAQLLTAVDPDSLQDIDEKRQAISPILTELTNRLNTYTQEADREVNTEFEGYKTKHATIETDFKKEYDDMLKYAAPAPDLNGSLQSIFEKFGPDLLSDQHTGFENDDDFQTVLNAYIADETNIDISTRLSSFEALFRHASQTGNLADKNAVVDAMKSFKRKIESSKGRAQRKMKNDVQDWYRYVVMGSSLDDPFAIKDEFNFYTFNASDDKLAENHKVGTYASGGIGFFRNLMYDTYISWLTDGDYGGIKQLKNGVVEKHRRASKRFSGPPPSDSKIGVDEILIWGMHNAITESHRKNIVSEIITHWNAVTWLDSTATLEDIRRTYNAASRLGEEINNDAKYWTTRKKAGYDKMDDKVNEASSWTFAAIDKLRGYASRKIPIFGRREEDYDVDAISAIEPQWRPDLQLLLYGSAALIGTGLTISAIKKALMSGQFAEVIKEIGIATGVSLGIGELRGASVR